MAVTTDSKMQIVPEIAMTKPQTTFIRYIRFGFFSHELYIECRLWANIVHYYVSLSFSLSFSLNGVDV